MARYEETFNQADSATVGPVLTWTQVVGTWDTLTQRLRLTDVAGGPVSDVIRAEADLSTSDMSCEVTVAWSTNLDNCGGPAVRFASAATTAYYTFVQTGQQYLAKNIGGTQTLLGNAPVTQVSPQIFRLEVFGSTLRTYYGGVLINTITDTSITGNTRGGVMGYNVTGNTTFWTLFTIQDYAPSSYDRSSERFPGLNTPLGQLRNRKFPRPTFDSNVSLPAAVANYVSVLATPARRVGYGLYVAGLRLGRQRPAVPTQDVAPPLTVQPRRARGLRRMVGSQVPPVLPQVPVPPYIPAAQVQPRRLRGWRMFRGSGVAVPPAPQIAVVSNPQPRRVRGWRIFRARLVSPTPAPIAIPPYIPQEQVQPRRARGWRLFRGRQVTPVRAPIAVPPFIPPSTIQPRRARGWRLFRGSQVPVPPAPQTAVVLPPPVSAPQPRRLRGWRVFRRALSMVPVQELVPGNVERRVHRLGRKTRGTQATPVPGQVPVPSYPVPATQRRTLRGWRRFRGSQPSIYPNSVAPNTPPPYPVPNVARRIQRLWLARRGKQAPVVPAQVPVPPTPPVTAVQPRRTRGWRLARPGRPTSAATLQDATVPGRGAASRQRIPAPRRRSRAFVIGASDAPPSTLDPARRPQVPGRRWGRARTPVPVMAVSGPLTRTARRRQPILARIRRYLRWVPGVGGPPADPNIKYPLSLVVVSSGTTYAVVQVDGLLYALLTDGGVRYLAPQGSGSTAVTPTSDGGSSLLVVSS